jgi:predicted RNA-binding protein YlxR (DUF448 family)
MPKQKAAPPPKQAPRPRHIPQRTCVACRQVQAKSTLVRLVRTPEGVFPDEKGKRPGRGAYLHARSECWQPGIEKNLPHALNTTLTETDKQRLTEYFAAVSAVDDSVK